MKKSFNFLADIGERIAPSFLRKKSKKPALIQPKIYGYSIGALAYGSKLSKKMEKEITDLAMDMVKDADKFVVNAKDIREAYKIWLAIQKIR